MPPKDGSKDSESKKTKKWTPVPCLPQEDARNENVPKLPRKPRKNQRNKKQATKADDAQEFLEEKLDKPSEKPSNKSKGRFSRRRIAQRRGPPAKKVEERSETTPDEDNEAKARSDEPSEKKTPGHNGKALNGSAGEDEGRGGLPEAVPSEVDHSSEVDEIPERLFRCFFSQRTDMQAFVGIMRIFQNDTDKTLQRIHHLVITMLLDDFQSFPYWPEKELLMVGELLGQFIRWDLIPDGGPLQLALCCILSALKESPTSLLYRFGQRALEQFLCRFAHHDVASQMCRQMQLSQPPLHEEEEVKQKEHHLHLNPVMFPAQPVFLPWPWFPPVSQPDLVMRMLIPQAQPVPAPAPTRAHNAGRPKVGQQELSKWMFGHASKAAPRPAGSKQGILGWQEPEKERREKEKDAGKTSKKKASAKSKKTNVESSGQKAGPSSGTTPLPSFTEVDMESMEFQLSDEDVADMQVRREEKDQENEENEEKEKEDEAELDLSGDAT